MGNLLAICPSCMGPTAGGLCGVCRVNANLNNVDPFMRIDRPGQLDEVIR